MKKTAVVIIGLLFLNVQVPAQSKISIDLAGIHNTQKPITGMNVSGFYYFNKRFTTGLEVNRFFPVTFDTEEENIKISGWDIELNMHYLLPLYRELKIYPITGVGFTADREYSLAGGHGQDEAFWSLNTGTGILYELGNWSPHIEYTFTWGQLNQQFLLAGISYEIPLPRHHHSH